MSPLDPISFIAMGFSAKSCQIIAFPSKLENPGSATAFLSLILSITYCVALKDSLTSVLKCSPLLTVSLSMGREFFCNDPHRLSDIAHLLHPLCESNTPPLWRHNQTKCSCSSLHILSVIRKHRTFFILLYIIEIDVRVQARADPGFPVRGNVDPPVRGRQHTILPKFPKNCMGLRRIWAVGGGSRGSRAGGAPLDPPLLGTVHTTHLSVWL